MSDIRDYSQYTNTMLHTNYWYIRNNKFDKIRHVRGKNFFTVGDAEEKAKKLREKENKFYNSWGCQSEEEFFDLLKNFEGISVPDKEAFKKFTNYGANGLISKIIANRNLKTKPVKEQVTVTINTEDLNKKLNKTFRNYFNIDNDFIKTQGELNLSFEPTPKAFKVIFNALRGTHYQVNSFNSDALLKDFDTLADGLSFTLNGQAVSKSTLKSYIPVLPFPWGYKPEEIRDMINNDPDRKEEIKREVREGIINPLKAYCGYDGTSSAFQRAFDLTLKKLLGGTEDEIIHKFFLGGENWENVLKGALGEFGTSLIFHYIKIAFKNPRENSKVKPVIKLIGNETRSITGEKRKIDVLTNGFGVQVKNYLLNKGTGDVNITQNAISVRQHPVELGEYLEENDRQSFYGFITNYFFNPVSHRLWQGEMLDALRSFLAKYLTAEVLRLASKDIEDTVCFYNISNTYFIPGSALFDYYSKTVEDESKLKVDITSSIKTYGDGVSRGENDYWMIETDGSRAVWAPTDKNRTEFAEAIRKRITIEAKMNTLLKTSFEKYKLGFF